jgi:putative membrane protein
MTGVHEGLPLVPHDAWNAWSFEPVVVLGLGLSAWLYVRGIQRLWRSAGRGRGVRRWEAGTFAAGWIVLLLALGSPLHRLGGVLFSAHMAQHELLMAVAAPLLVLGRPLVPFVWALPMNWRRTAGHWAAIAPVQHVWGLITLPLVAWSLHALAIWLWHAPLLFQATLRSEWIHTLQHLSFLGTGLLFWWALLRGQGGRLGRPAAVLYLFTTSVHTTVLGALFAFSSRVWYPLYTSSTAAWGITPLEDQQLAGLIMWVPAGLAYLIAALAISASWLKEGERPERALVLHGSLLLAACKGSPSEQAQHLQQSQQSWQATVQTTTELRQRGAVPEVYARQTVEAAKEELEKNRKKSEQLSR